MLDAGDKASRVLISGRVQGVFFRDWTVRKANELTLNGWVRNRSDGTVEGLFVGPEVNVDKMVKLCEIGPPLAKVTDIEITKAMGITKNGFVQKPSVNLRERRGD